MPQRPGAPQEPGKGEAPQRPRAAGTPKPTGLFRKREYKTLPVSRAVQVLFEQLGGADQVRLVQLWKHWEMVMGEMQALGRPLGHKEGTLLIGAEDAMAMQELVMQTPELLERANAFMDEDYFVRVKVLLMQDQPDLARPRDNPDDYSPPPLPAGPPLGGRLEDMDPDSPVTRCYRAWVEKRRKTP